MFILVNGQARLLVHKMQFLTLKAYRLNPIAFHMINSELIKHFTIYKAEHDLKKYLFSKLVSSLIALER